MDGAGGRLIGIGAQGDGLRSVGQPRERWWHPGSGHRSSQHSALGWRGAELEKDTQLESRSEAGEGRVLYGKGALGFARIRVQPSASVGWKCGGV